MEEVSQLGQSLHRTVPVIFDGLDLDFAPAHCDGVQAASRSDTSDKRITSRRHQSGTRRLIIDSVTKRKQHVGYDRGEMINDKEKSGPGIARHTKQTFGGTGEEPENRTCFGASRELCHMPGRHRGPRWRRPALGGWVDVV